MKDPVRNITLVISSLSMGGAERVMSMIANHAALSGKQVTLITLAARSMDFWTLDPGVNRVGLDLIGESSNPVQGFLTNLQRIFRLRRAIREAKPDVLLSFMDTVNILALIACLGFSIPVLVAERSNPEVSPPRKPWETLKRWIYPLAYCVIVQTERAKVNLSKTIRARMAVIPNPVMAPDSELIRSSVSMDPPIAAPDRPRVIAMGRLAREKRFDLLIRAFSQLKDRHPAWRLAILGEGSSRGELEALRNELGLEDRVSLPGRTSNAPEALKASDLFVLSSDFEGFPNALCEAMACGLPVIATDCPSGPREIIRDGIDGILTPPGDAEALAAAMDRLMTSEGERERLGRRALEIVDRFGIEKVMLMWESLFAEAAACPRMRLD